MADQRIRDLALIFAGGGAGAVVRVLLDFPEFGPWMPANFLACFLMGLSSAILMEGWMSPAASSWWRPLVPTGFLGGLSTFSVLSIASVLQFPGSLLLEGLRLLLLLAAFFAAALAGYLIPVLIARCLNRKSS